MPELIKKMWLNTSMSSAVGSVLAALVFLPHYPEANRFLAGMAVFGISLLASVPLLAVVSFPCFLLVRTLAEKYRKFIFLATLCGGMTGAVAAILLLVVITLLMGKDMLNSLIPGILGRIGTGFNLILTGFAYGSVLALFTALNLPDQRREWP